MGFTRWHMSCSRLIRHHCVCIGMAVVAAKSVVVRGGGLGAINAAYFQRKPDEVPAGFSKTCKEMNWPPKATWQQLSDGKRPWFEAENDAYIYFNRADGQWWIDSPSGAGAYVARSDTDVPPMSGWSALHGIPPVVPVVEIHDQELWLTIVGDSEK